MVVEPEAPGFREMLAAKNEQVHPPGQELTRLNVEETQPALSLFLTETVYALESPGAPVCVAGPIVTVGFPLMHGRTTLYMAVPEPEDVAVAVDVIV